MCHYNISPFKELRNDRRKIDTMSKDNMVISLIIKEGKKVIKNVPKMITCCPPALSFLWTLVLEGQMFLDLMSVPSLPSCWVQYFSLISPADPSLVLGQGLGQPVESFVQPAALGGAGWLDVPLWGQRGYGVSYIWKKYKCNSAHDYKLHSGVYGACLLTFLLRRACRPSFSVSSLTGKALGRSCLLANTSKTASFNSSSVN